MQQLSCPFLNYKYMDEKQEQFKYVIYRRKSSEGEDKQTLSLASQKRELAKFSNQNNLKIITDLEESQSAYKKGREGFAEMIELINRGKANAILVYHISRLARNMTDGGLIIDMLKDGIIKEVRTPTEAYTKDSGQSFFLALQFAMSKKSSDDTSQFVKRDIQAKLIKGELPNFAPRGYLNIDPNGKISGKTYSLDKQIELGKLGRPLKRVERDPLLYPLIVQLFEECATGGYTLDKLREITFKWGLSGGRSQKKMTKSGIYRILTNPFYYGGIRWTGRIIEPYELPTETRHEPIINKELFERVQEVLGLRSLYISKKKFYPYSNFITCGVCGGNISGITSKGLPYYRCCKCTGLNYIRETDLEEQISKRMDELTMDEDFYKLAMREANIENEKEILQREAVKKQQQAELSRCQQRLDNLLRLKISPDNKDGVMLSDEEFINQKKETLQEMAIIKEKMGDTESQSQHWFDLCSQYVDFMRKLNIKFKNGTPEKRREIFQFIYYNPTITAKVLANNEFSPHKFVFEYNNYKQSTITAENSMNTNKKDALASLCSVGRRILNEVRTYFQEKSKDFS
jgi:DNA invertase Pin-like site-specific DNA recombinase